MISKFIWFAVRIVLALQPRTDQDVACLYEHHDEAQTAESRYKCFQESGTYQLGDFDFNDLTTSVFVKPGCIMQVWDEGINLGPEISLPYLIRDNNGQIVPKDQFGSLPEGWNDVISAVRITCGVERVACVFADLGFKGDSRCITDLDVPPNGYLYPLYREDIHFNDVTTSIFVKPGYLLKAYDVGDLTGPVLELGSFADNLAFEPYKGWDNVISVITVTPPQAAASDLPPPIAPPPVATLPVTPSNSIDPAKTSHSFIAGSVDKGLGFASVVWNYEKGVATGAKDAVVGAVTGFWNMIRHPIQTANALKVNIIYAGKHPKETALAIGNSIKAYCTDEGALSAEAAGKCVGNAATQLGMLLIPVAGEGNAFKVVVKGSEMGAEAEEVAGLISKIPLCTGPLRRALSKRSPVGVACMVAKEATEVAEAIKNPKVKGISAASHWALAVREAYQSGTSKVLEAANAEYLAKAQSVVRVSSANPEVGIMSKLAESPKGFRGTSNAEINAWISTMEETEYIDEEFSGLYTAQYGIGPEEQQAIKSWLVDYKNGVDPRIHNAVEKLPKYEGYVIRNTNLDAPSLQSIESALASGKPLRMDSFVKNAVGKKYPKATTQVMASTPAGSALSFEEKSAYRLVIKSKTGRLISPMNIPRPYQQEVVIEGMAKSFKVLAKGPLASDETVTVYFLEELI